MSDLNFMILEWSGAILGLIGAVFVTKKQTLGFLIVGVYNILWCVLGVFREQYGIVFLMVTYLVLNLWGYVKWKREGAEEEKISKEV